MSYLIIQKDDEKSKFWKKACETYEVDIFLSKKSSVLMPFFLIKNLFYNGKPSAVIIRYLNDYPSFFKTIFLKIASEILLALICVLFRIKLIWFCHNVDSETISNYPLLTKFRRFIITSCASRILVMDELLKEKAKEIFYKHQEKIDSISFGHRDYNTSSIDLSNRVDVSQFISKVKLQREKNPKTMLGFCPGTAVKGTSKCLHFDLIPKLIQEGKKNDINIYLIVVGPISKYLESKSIKLRDFIKNSPNVLFIDEFVDYNPTRLSSHIDFYWRVYSDWSVGYTLYEACTVKKPILTVDYGFLAMAVDRYKLGGVLNRQFENFKHAVEALDLWNLRYADDFLKNHNWNNAAKKIIKASGLEVKI